MALFSLEPAIDGAGTDREKLAFHLRSNGDAPLGPGEPQGQQGFEADRPRVAGCLPDPGKDRQRARTINLRAPASRWPGMGAPGLAQPPDRSLAMVAGGSADLGEDLVLGGFGGGDVSVNDGANILLLRSGAQSANLPGGGMPVRLGNILRDKTIGLPVTI